MLVAAAALFALAPRAEAFKASTERWTLNRTVVMHLSLGVPQTLQDGFPSFNESAADALRIWNRQLAHLQFAPRVASPLPAEDGDAATSVLFSSTAYGTAFGSRTLAITLISARGTITTETDTLFNNARTWDSYRGPLQDSVQDFHRVALHEFGHSLGLDHPDQAGQTVVAIMNSTISDLDALQPDDIAGGQSIYNNGPAYRTIPAAPNLVALSTRGFVGTGDNVLIGGFSLDGSQSSAVIMRAIGNSLGSYNVPTPLRDPQIELFNSNGTRLAQNDDWIDSADAETIASYRLDPPNSTESAILRTLAPGNYTAIVRAFDNNDGRLTGNALVEIYDLHANAGGRARSISTRGQVMTGDDVIIAGFNIGGTTPKEVVLRGIGPSLAAYNVPGSLADPTIEVRSANGQLVATNDNWQTDPRAAQVQARSLAPANSAESALDLVLAPGAYTAILRGAGNATGISLVEVYDTAPAP